MMNQCPFCKIACKEVQAEIIYEDDYSIAFLDANPSSPGHTLLIPKKHFPDIQEIEDDLLCNLSRAIKTITKMIKEALGPDGFTIGINQGACAGARVPHLHIHIIPRFENDKGAMVQMVVKNPPEESLSMITEKIRNCSLEEVPEHILKQMNKEEEETEIVSEESSGEECEEKEKELEECEKEELKEKEKEYKGEKDIKDKEEDELEKYEKILRQMKIPR